MPRFLVAAVLATALALLPGLAAAQDAPRCVPDGDPVVLTGEVETEDARTYGVFPFEVAAGTTRVEVDYDWADRVPAPSTPLTQTVLDLGLWDQDGYREQAGFRGWSGSRHRSVFVQSDDAERTYFPGTVEPGVWWAELGFAAVGPSGASWEVHIRCLDPEVGPPPEPDPVDPDHVADPSPGWYHGDFHMHGFHSNPNAPDYQAFAHFARSQGLDFFPLTEYVTGVHWEQLGAVQRANPDVLFWPSREIITYFGHAISLGPTPGYYEYRHGFEDITIGAIQREVVARGALFQIAHPTTFEGPAFRSFCRGCEWELSDEIDLRQVHTIEVQTGPGTVHPGGDPDAPAFENPFMAEAIELWEDLLNQGYRITAVGGSDDKLSGDGPTDPIGATTYAPHGVPATAVFADELSVDAIARAVRAGRAYVRVRGVADSPALELDASTDGGQRATFGGILAADEADVTVTVTGGDGQSLRVIRNGDVVETVPVSGDVFTHTWRADRTDDEGPLGTWWRVETLDHESRSTIANPVFLVGASASDPRDGAPGGSQPPGGPGNTGGATTPTTGATGALALAPILAALVAWRRR
ncbi:MAG: CehA/McbA family metallohydrolase [Actinobacteria bacterium]|nr:CehA/McbA family metallohydrolase [Actinomycetota bacterium]